MLSALNMAISNFYGCFHEYLEGNPMHDGSPLAPTFLGTEWRPNASTCIRRYSLEDRGMAPKGSKCATVSRLFDVIQLMRNLWDSTNGFWHTLDFAEPTFTSHVYKQGQCPKDDASVHPGTCWMFIREIYEIWHMVDPEKRFNRDPQIWYNMV